MANHPAFAPVVIESAGVDDALRAGMIHALAYRQKRSVLRDNALDITMVRNYARAQADMYCQNVQDADAYNVIARVPEFDTAFPLERRNGFQDAGWAEIYKKPDNSVRIGWIYTVKSPYRVGSALMHHVITMAADMGADRITAHAAYAASAQWFHERALFGPYDPNRRWGQEMSLGCNRFRAALRHLRR